MSELDNQLTALANAIREIAAPEGTGAMSLDDMATLLGAAEWRDDFLKSLIERTATSITIPNGATCIGIRAVSGCTALTSITIPNGVTSIEDNAFSDCVALTSITLPSSVTRIGRYAFISCAALASVTIPNSVNNIGGGAFWGCTALASVTIPGSVTSIGDSAFESCINLTDIYCGFEEGAVSGAPWGAPDTTTIHYGAA